MLDKLERLPTNSYEPENWAYWADALSKSECERTISYFNELPRERGTAGDKLDINKRDVNIVWLPKDDEHQWIYDRIFSVGAKLNEQFFRFDLDGSYEQIQISRYGVGEHYSTWHMDRSEPGFRGSYFPRKLTLVMQLSDPGSYDGGELQFFTGEDPAVAPKERGTLSAHDSRMPHRVAPVTRGERYSLVVWFGGPPFK